MGATAWCRTACYLKLSGAGHGPMLCPKSDHHLNALRLGNRTKRPTAQTRHPGQWLVPRTRRGNTVAPSSNGRLHYLKFSAGVVDRVSFAFTCSRFSWSVVRRALSHLVDECKTTSCAGAEACVRKSFASPFRNCLHRQHTMKCWFLRVTTGKKAVKRSKAQ